ncbi:hypothetical protein CC53_gp171 [Rhizobium phage vB_RleS_L338C]|uniref:hypothetical protein n=1 Tax=Rhizobium phage vB_RleS_L338C TaxID=1414737 RepID=UPI0003D7C69A|nr:hypothetical protein CC53_gp171 [Rhizobium phage vB_RleS_L338C]AHC30588.1 hypothetical protein L338C_171 [Rhizobium phage vB_RleS_L338C]QNH72185.1 hypothetical protein P11VFA_147 [Rhizobium phage P11VFA]
MRVLVIDQHGESRTFEEADIVIEHPMMIIVDVAGMHLYPLTNTVFHCAPETEKDTDIIAKLVEA